MNLLMFNFKISQNKKQWVQNILFWYQAFCWAKSFLLKKKFIKTLDSLPLKICKKLTWIISMSNSHFKWTLSKKSKKLFIFFHFICQHFNTLSGYCSAKSDMVASKSDRLDNFVRILKHWKQKMRLKKFIKSIFINSFHIHNLSIKNKFSLSRPQFPLLPSPYNHKSSQTEPSLSLQFKQRKHARSRPIKFSRKPSS